MSEKDQAELQKELAALDVEQKRLYDNIRAGKLDEIVKSIEGPAEGPEELEKARLGVSRSERVKGRASKEALKFEGEDDDDDDDDEKPAPKKADDKPKEDEPEEEKDEEGPIKIGPKGMRSVAEQEAYRDQEFDKWKKKPKKVGKPLQGPVHDMVGVENDEQQSRLMNARFKRLDEAGGVDDDDLDKPREYSATSAARSLGNVKEGQKVSRTDRYYDNLQGYDPPGGPKTKKHPEGDKDAKRNMNWMWDRLPGVSGVPYEEINDRPKNEKDKKNRSQGTQLHSGADTGKRNITFQNFFNQLHRTPDNAAYWKTVLGKAVSEVLAKSMEIMVEYMYTTMGEALQKSLYSDYESDLIELVKSEFEAERDLAIEEIAKMVMDDKEFVSDLEEIQKAYDEDVANEDELVKAINAIADAVTALFDGQELIKAALAGEDAALEEIAKSVKKKKKHLLARYTPQDSRADPDEVDLEDEGDDDEVKKADDELEKSGNGGAGSDSSDSKECVRKGDITTKDLKSHTEEGIFPKSTPQPVNKTDAFENGRKLGVIEAIQKSVADSGVATPPPGETVNAERLDPIAKMLNDDQMLLNTSFNRLERQLRETD